MKSRSWRGVSSMNIREHAEANVAAMEEEPLSDEVVGDTNPLLAGMPPQVVCYHFLYQLRAFANAGFHALIVVSGHAGGSQKDLRRVANAFTKSTGIPVVVKTDPEWGGYEGDHAGAYEISQLQAIHPEAVDLSLLERMNDEGSGGRLALGPDAAEASPEKATEINETIIAAIGAVADDLGGGTPIKESITYQLIEEIWSEVLAQGEWWSMGLK